MLPLRHIFVLVLSVGLTAAVPASHGPGAVATPDVVAEPRLGARVPATTAEGTGLIRLMAGAFDPTRSLAPVPASIPHVDPTTLDVDAATYWLAQVTGDALVGARSVIDEAGAVVEGVVPDATYVIRATPVQAAAVGDSDAVRAVVLYQPGWKVPVALGQYEGLLDVEGPQRYHVHLWDSAPDPSAARAAVGAITGARVLEASDRVLTVAATREQVPAIVAVTDVAWVELEPTVVPLNAQARWVNDTAVRDLPNVLTDQRLDGTGQTAGVADTGVNYVPDRNGTAHVSFRDCSGGTVHEPTGCREADYVQAQPGTGTGVLEKTVRTEGRHRKMAAYFDLGATGPNPSDLSAHGTHVAGSVTGDHGTYGTWDGEDGMAPGARLVHQNIGSPGGGLATPSNSYRLWQQAYRPRDPASVTSRPSPPITYAQTTAAYRPDEDARTHNNSYGLVVPSVSLGSAEAADRFVWEHEDMVIVSSAGNSGPVPFSIGAPSLGKNVVTSAASANGRQPMASIDSIASFSSHGPTGDGRLGVDLATPGQTVISAKGGTADEFHYLQGTSMSGPVLTGFATLVRQYFWDGYGPGTGADGVTASGFAAGSPADVRRHNPSAALVRAALVNGARRMEGWYSGDDGSQREMDGQYPSAGQGFGLVNLTDSLFFDDEQGRSTRNAWFTDVWRADDAAFDIGTGKTREYAIDVAPGEPLSVTLTYTDAPSELGLGTPYRVNDLDLVVRAPDGTLYSGNNFNTRTQPKAEQEATLPGLAPDPNNPVERVLIPAPAAGTWTVQVIGTEVAVGPQGFALAATGLIDEADATFTPTFAAGEPLQVDVAGAPAVANVAVETVDHNIARVTWTTSEPTTGAVELRGPDGARSFVDVYNHDGPTRGNDGDPGYDGLEEGPVETSEEYANKPVISTDHEVLVTGLGAGEQYELVVRSTDLAGNTITAPPRTYTATSAIFGAQAFDIAQLVEAPTDAIATYDPILGVGDGAYGLGTQLYAGESRDGLLGAFMFRLPEDLDPSRITGAAVELTSMHDLTNHYESDLVTYVDLLPELYEEDWQGNNYRTIHTAPSVARALPETGYRRGGQKTYPFSFACTDLDALKSSLSTVQEGERRAAFRFDAETAIPGLFSHEFGFNRRSRGADLRPRLVLFLDGRDPSACDASAPAPAIVDVGVQEAIGGETDDDGNHLTRAVTVSWQTDVPGDSTVLFREQGSNDRPTAVNHPSLTTTHGVTVLGLDPAKTYEFAVASANCAGRVTVDDNGDQGYLLYPPEFPTADDLTDDQFTTFFFHGSGADQGEKTAQFGGSISATFSTAEPDGPPSFQYTTGLANTSFVENPLAAYWTGPVEGPFELNGPLVFEWYWGGSAPRETTVDVVVFADPDRSDGASAVQPERIVASGTVPITVTTGPVPSQLSVGSIPVRDGTATVQGELVIQVTGGSLEDDDLVVHYDSPETPSRFRVPTVQLAQPPAEMPDAGPVPPDPSDGFSAAAPPQQGTPTDAARAAGTARCGTVTRTAKAPDAPAGPGTGEGTGGSDTGRPGEPAGATERADERGRGPDSACDPRRAPASPFEDTSRSVHEESIRCIAWYQITRGVGDPDGDGREEYAPLWRVDRAQMASFIARLAIEAGIDLDEDAPDAFSDDDGLVHEPAIDALAAAGLVEGVDDERFEPAAEVSRAQMASFITRVHMAATGTRQDPQRDHFGDDDGTHHERNINVLADLGVVRGVGDTDGDGRSEYRPAAAVTRGQMASFIGRDLDLLAAAGRAHAGGAEVFLRTTRVAPGEEVRGQVRSHKSIRSLRAHGCGIDGAPLSVAGDGTFTVHVPEDQEEGACELALTVTTQRGFQRGDGQDVVYRFDMTIDAPA